MKWDRPIIALFACALMACGLGSPPEPVPEGAENPIVFRFRTVPMPEAVEVIAEACSAEGITVQEVDPSGYVETRWVDIAAWYPVASEPYPLRERQVQYRFEVTEAAERSLQLSIAAYYQPNRPPGVVIRASATYDQLVPTDHPGYQLALELRTNVRVGLRSLGAVLIEEGG